MMDIQKGDVVKFVDSDPEFADMFGSVGTVLMTDEASDKLGCETDIVQVDYHYSYGVHRPDQLEKLW